MEGRRIFPIEWHVNYWDYLGWADTLANPSYTDRQERYAAIFRTGVYTPEMVISAEEERGSTNGATVNAHIEDVLENPVEVSTTLWLESAIDAEELEVGYLVEGAR